MSMYKKVNHSKCQLESYTRPVPNKAANSKFELNKLNFSNISNLESYCHSDTSSDTNDVTDSVTSTLSQYPDSDTSISSDDVTDDVDDVTCDMDDVTDDVTSSYDFYSDSNSLSTKSTTTDSLSSNTVGSSHSEIEEASVAEQSDLKVTYTVAELLPVAENLSKPGFKRRSTWSHHSNKSQSKKVIKVLMDSGSDGDLLFHEKGTPKHFSHLTRQVLQSWHTSKGNFYTNERASIDLQFFHYSESKRYSFEPDVVEYEAHNKPMFDLILGAETLEKLGIVLDFRTKEMTIDEITLPMRDVTSLSTKSKMYKAWKMNNSLRMDNEPASTLEATKRCVKILDANYKKADLPSVVKDNCSHLNPDEQAKLLELLMKYEDLFDGTLGDWKTEPVSFELKEGARPYHGRPYPVPKVHKLTTKKECDRLEELGVIKWEGDSPWASPSFITPKKDGTVRFISDFRELNKRIVRKPFPLPKISTVLQELEGFTFATALDLNMGYYTIRLDPESSKICTIIFPWGKYSYQRLPMGVATSPDIFQAKMSELMATLEFVRAYIDDLLCITKGSLEDHLAKLGLVLTRLQDAGLKVNAGKSFFCAVETEYLGYILTRDGIKPQPKKVQAILALTPPTNVRQLRRFLGMVQYYRDLWARRSEMLAPLTDLVGECGVSKARKGKPPKKWYWNEVHQKAFDDVKATIAKDVVLAYPDFNEEFEIYTDGSTKQLGAVITQRGRPLAFFSRKLTTCQQKYSITEIELLAIVECLKEFKGMLWGQRVKVYTDHKNLMQDALGFTSDRVYRWRLLIEEYGPEIVWVKGVHNTVADAISRLEYSPIKCDKVNWMTFTKTFCFYICKSKSSLGADQSKVQLKESMNLVFANRSEEEAIFPLTVSEIAESQSKDKGMNKLAKKEKYTFQLVENTKVLCKDGKLVIPNDLQHRAISWYHHYLQHPGSTRLEETIRASMYWKGMRPTIRSYVKKCKTCQINKRRQRKYGKLPAKLAITTPWEALCVDLIGPYTLKGKDKSQIDFMCLTMIDPATGWFEIVELPVLEPVSSDAPDTKKGRKRKRGHDDKPKEAYFDKSSAMISSLVNKTWFCRYPRCQHIIYDNGSEFKLHFRALCDTFGIKRKPTSVKNPQANAILERVHQTIMGMVRTAEIDMADTVAPRDIEDFLSSASWAIRSTYHTVLKASPGAAIFGRDMMFDIPFLADWKHIGDFRQRQTDRNTARENKSRVDWDYKVGDEILLRKDGILRKSESPFEKEPWTITQVHTNGTVRAQRGTSSERFNIRRITPYFK